MLVFPQPLRQPTAQKITEGRLSVDQEVNDHSQGGSGSLNHARMPSSVTSAFLSKSVAMLKF